MIYLDSAATSLLKPPGVAEAVSNAVMTLGGAGRGGHGPAHEAALCLYRTRSRLAELLGAADPSEIAFTSNATQSLNTAICGLIHPGDHVITTVCEHNSVLRPLYRLEKEGVLLTVISADRQGHPDYEAIRAACRPETKAIVITHASNLTGNLTDISRVSRIAREQGLLLIVDAAQTAGTIPIDVQRDGIDVLCFSGHKGLMGPQGIGGIYVRRGVKVRPLCVGGSGVKSFEQEHPEQMPEALEAGTPNAPGAAGLLAAIEWQKAIGTAAIREREQMLTGRFSSQVMEIPGVICYGDPDCAHRTATVAINIEDLDSQTVSAWLWEDYGIAVRGGAHCAPLMHRFFGTEAQGMVRFSFSYFNTEAEIDQAVLAVRELAAEAQQ